MSLSRGARRRRAAAAGLALAAAFLALALLLGRQGDDPFSGVYWEPASGRRVEIARQGDSYVLYYGVARRPFPAVREGDTLRLRDPLGGTIVVRPAGDGGLRLEGAGAAGALRPLEPQ